MAPLETGTYSVTNAGFNNSAELADGNYGTPVTCNAYTDRDSFKLQWKVTMKWNGRYRLENKGAANKVYSGDHAQVNAEVTARPQDQEWAIEETNTGTYTISTIGTLNKWRLDNGDADCPVTLSAKSDVRSQWSFVRRH
ncbi:hypothetical protein BDZ89DRAFT_52290 [Hymenopellis radicata]|nr:hypothetical protein BDZ89DRAFT_52290 [Hymenopellis radicata]